MNHVVTSFQLPTYSPSNQVRLRGTLSRWLAIATLGILAPFVSARADSRLSNLSNRILIGYGQSITAGLTIGGSGTETVLIRGIGPGLKNYGITNPVPDPRPEHLQRGQHAGGRPDQYLEVLRRGHHEPGRPFTPGQRQRRRGGHSDAPGRQLHRERPVPRGTTGIALIEVYEVSHTGTAQLLNLSSRARSPPIPAVRSARVSSSPAAAPALSWCAASARA